MHPDRLTKRQANEFLDKLSKLSAFPQKAYEDFAGDIRYLAQKGYKTDPFNPNNLLVTDDAINTIDYFKIPARDPHKFKTSVYDMIYPLLDVALFERYHSLLDNDRKTELLAVSRTIVDKCFRAAAACRLPGQFDGFFVFLSHIDKYFGHALPEKNFRQRLEEANRLLGASPSAPLRLV